MAGFRNFVVGCVLGAASILSPAAPALAVPLATPHTVSVEKDVQTVEHRRSHYRRHWRNDRWRGDGWRHHRRYYRPGVNVYIAPRPVYRDRYIRRGSSGHVNWCLSRYRSYNPATNLFLAYGGVYKTCYSPYR
ncbi:BA14K family protein [Pararhizobium gei]|uniref:BA14K family protein n=1 Tax=Pararhizobium gei TaxID=1395951 RepID=UPI0023DAF7D0|nr:BA14K family protein [Rhizobium gei]